MARAVSQFHRWRFRDVRNQAVLLRGVNDTPADLLDLCFAGLDHAAITPYYVYMCDMVPGAEHWRTPLWQAQELQQSIMGALPGYATPRVVCDVPLLGKRWVHQVDAYDRELGISSWRPAPRTIGDPSDESGEAPHHFYDPIDTLPESGRAWWRRNAAAQGTAGD